MTREEVDAVRFYSGDGYQEINDMLRGDAAGSPVLESKVDILDRVIAASTLATDLTVYRGVSGAYAAMLRRVGIRSGMVIREPAFVSSSIDSDIASIFAAMPPRGFVFEIRLPAGSAALDIAPYSAYPDEHEFLLPRDAAFRIKGYRASDDVVLMELI